jgi:hypothetical protein
MAIGTGKSFPIGQKFETYTVRLFPMASYYYAVKASLAREYTNLESSYTVRKLIHGHWVDCVYKGVEGEAKRLETYHHKLTLEWSEDVGARKRISRIGDGREHTVRVPIYTD